MNRKFKNNPIGRIERFLCEHEKEMDDWGGTFSSMKTYTVAPFIVKHLAKLTELAVPKESDSDEYVRRTEEE